MEDPATCRVSVSIVGSWGKLQLDFSDDGKACDALSLILRTLKTLEDEHASDLEVRGCSREKLDRMQKDAGAGKDQAQEPPSQTVGGKTRESFLAKAESFRPVRDPPLRRQRHERQVSTMPSLAPICEEEPETGLGKAATMPSMPKIYVMPRTQSRQLPDASDCLACLLSDSDDDGFVSNSSSSTSAKQYTPSRGVTT